MKRASVFMVLALVACARKEEPSPTASASVSASAPASASASAPAPASAPASASASASAFDASALAPYAADAGLTPREASELAGALAHFDAPCASVAVSVAQCLAEKRDCPACGLAAKYVALGVRAGWPHQYTELAYQKRFDPNGARSFAVDGLPTRGPDNAAVTIVEFGSYVCPHCAAEAPKLDAIQKAHPKEVRLVFKPAWSMTNPATIAPSRAALAAAQQGKFWEMHSLLFVSQPRFEDADLDGYATQVRARPREVPRRREGAEGDRPDGA